MFFDIVYIRGDNSEEGFKDIPMSLEKRTATEVEGIVNILDIPTGGKILDIPCGYSARHSSRLALRGYDVTAVDINPFFLREALMRYKKKLLHEDSRIESRLMITGAPIEIIKNLDSPKLTFHKRDMRKLGFKKEFDGLINMFFSFGFFDKDSDNEIVMENFQRALKKEGQLLIHTDVSPEMINSGVYKDIGHTKRNLMPTYIHSLDMTFPKAVLHITEEYDRSKGRINGIWEIEELDGTRNSNSYSVRIYSKGEYADLCRKAGFKDVSFYGGWNKEPFTGKEQEMIVHAKK